MLNWEQQTEFIDKLLINSNDPKPEIERDEVAGLQKCIWTYQDGYRSFTFPIRTGLSPVITEEIGTDLFTEDLSVQIPTFQESGQKDIKINLLEDTVLIQYDLEGSFKGCTIQVATSKNPRDYEPIVKFDEQLNYFLHLLEDPETLEEIKTYNSFLAPYSIDNKPQDIEELIIIQEQIVPKVLSFIISDTIIDPERERTLEKLLSKSQFYKSFTGRLLVERLNNQILNTFLTMYIEFLKNPEQILLTLEDEATRKNDIDFLGELANRPKETIQTIQVILLNSSLKFFKEPFSNEIESIRKMYLTIHNKIIENLIDLESSNGTITFQSYTSEGAYINKIRTDKEEGVLTSDSITTIAVQDRNIQIELSGNTVTITWIDVSKVAKPEIRKITFQRSIPIEQVLAAAIDTKIPITEAVDLLQVSVSV